MEAQQKLADQSAKEIAAYPVFADYTPELLAAVDALAATELATVYKIADKQERQNADDALKASVKEAIAAKVTAGEFDDSVLSMVGAAYKSVTKRVMRTRVLAEGVRIDGRGTSDIRVIDAEVDIIPRVHGSALFQRGETQIMGVTTLNMLKMEQQIDSLNPVRSKRYMHHYNFPPYSTGETGRVGTPKRREIGHGFLAERALVPVLPSREEFPYAIRQVSEALSSNGSTSMGSVCASTLSMLNAGVPLKAPVAGIAMGLISDEVKGEMRYAALTDILGAEDALGDMDFKVAGTSEFVTAIQLDTKLDGIPASVLASALTQAKEARMHILGVMNEAIDSPDEMAATAPRVITVQIPADKIGELIGPKGKTINSIQDETGAQISIDDDGTVYIGAVDGESAEALAPESMPLLIRLTPRWGSSTWERSSRSQPSVPSFPWSRVKMVCSTSPRCASLPVASEWTTSKTYSLWVKKSWSKSPRLMTAASSPSHPLLPMTQPVRKKNQPSKHVLTTGPGFHQSQALWPLRAGKKYLPTGAPGIDPHWATK